MGIFRSGFHLAISGLVKLETNALLTATAKALCFPAFFPTVNSALRFFSYFVDESEACELSEDLLSRFFRAVFSFCFFFFFFSDSESEESDD